MKIGLMYANIGPFVQPDNFENLVCTAEEVGIESIFTVEHVIIPDDYKTEFPYSKTGKMPSNDETVPIPDPILPLVFAAALTKKLRLGTGVMILPQRHPAYVAKQMATLDVLSDGRAVLGVGIGWLEEEFEALGIPFKERASRADESIRAIRSLWSENPCTFNGRFYKWGPVHSNPKPVQPSGLPIIIGGQVENAAKRAASLGDGYFWIDREGDLAVLKMRIETIRKECKNIGREPEEVEVTVGVGSGALLETPSKVFIDTILSYESMGVSRVVLASPRSDKEGVQRELYEFGDRVLSKL
ncbi:MAG: TIGR03619 family F420-dependent LLM class oxidoreductase [Candidatus Dadabacteria bacterium]|nr:TIGR03619 family F420-dependent LLM class oxidoreductase [Candidatus Dadabacteria bacterium]NIQ13906.1 TIGR03619 family F420-dependent LLM class oxidoreductase [Candidatus Dadabacteria bacterium]